MAPPGNPRFGGFFTPPQRSPIRGDFLTGFPEKALRIATMRTGMHIAPHPPRMKAYPLVETPRQIKIIEFKLFIIIIFINPINNICASSPWGGGGGGANWGPRLGQGGPKVGGQPTPLRRAEAVGNLLIPFSLAPYYPQGWSEVGMD